MAGKVTWLTPFFDAWAKKCGGELNCGAAAKILKPLVKEFGEAKILDEWTDYLGCTPPMYCSVVRFGEKHGLYGSEKANNPAPPPMARTRVV